MKSKVIKHLQSILSSTAFGKERKHELMNMGKKTLYSVTVAQKGLFMRAVVFWIVQ